MRLQARRLVGQSAGGACALVLLAALLAGCGASTDDFCDAAENLQSAGDLEDDTAAEIRAVKDAHAELVEVGTPRDMPDDAREGITVLGDALAELDDDATEADLQQFDASVGDEGLEKTEAFFVYVANTCIGG